MGMIDDWITEGYIIFPKTLEFSEVCRIMDVLSSTYGLRCNLNPEPDRWKLDVKRDNSLDVSEAEEIREYLKTIKKDIIDTEILSLAIIIQFDDTSIFMDELNEDEPEDE